MSLYGAYDKDNDLSDCTVGTSERSAWYNLLYYHYKYMVTYNSPANAIMKDKAIQDGWRVFQICVAPLADIPVKRKSWWKRLLGL